MIVVLVVEKLAVAQTRNIKERYDSSLNIEPNELILSILSLQI
jgi:hypothetical protein